MFTIPSMIKSTMTIARLICDLWTLNLYSQRDKPKVVTITTTRKTAFRRKHPQQPFQSVHQESFQKTHRNQRQQRVLRRLRLLQRVVYILLPLLLLLSWNGSIASISVATSFRTMGRLLRMKTPNRLLSKTIRSHVLQSTDAVGFIAERSWWKGSRLLAAGGNGAFVEALTISRMTPFRSNRLGNQLESGVQYRERPMFVSSSSSSPWTLQSTRCFSVHKTHEHEERNSNDIRDKNHSRMTAQPNDLSELAKSVRDKVMSLLRIGGHLERSKDCQRLVIVPIVAAVSGGCDSVALFHALMEWNEQLNKEHLAKQDSNTTSSNGHQTPLMLKLDITVVHFHHRQRPIEADEDYRLVRQLVESHNQITQSCDISFQLEDWNDRIMDPNDAKDTVASVFSQDKARVWRRDRLRDCANERLENLRRRQEKTIVGNEIKDGFDKIAVNSSDTCGSKQNDIPLGIVLTAHHDDDSYETVLIKLLRGVHLLNLHDRAIISSIVPMNDGGSSQKIPDTTKDEGERRANVTEDETTPEIYLVRPFVTDSKTIPNMNMLGYSKDDLVQYLVDRNLPWREDSSNHDPKSKYLRNRVRNELIPLLKDLTDDSFRTKRIPILLEQSKELYEDLEPRVKAYLDTAVVGNDGLFFAILPLHDNSQEESGNSQLVRSQALYQWMSMRIAQDECPPLKGCDDDVSPATVSSPSYGISYETLQRVVQQLDQYPDRQQWKLELGSGWTINRVGDVLRMRFEGNDKDSGSELEGQEDTSNDKTSIIYRHWGWTRVSIEEISEWSKEGKDFLSIQVPSTLLELSSDKSPSLEFVSMTLREAEAIDESNTLSLRFSPPWRNSSIKLRAFLRGQKVPTHLRDDTQLLFLVEKTRLPFQEDPEINVCDHKRLVAICIRQKWIVDKEFYITTCNDGNEETAGKHNTASKSILATSKSILIVQKK